MGVLSKCMGTKLKKNLRIITSSGGKTHVLTVLSVNPKELRRDRIKSLTYASVTQMVE